MSTVTATPGRRVKSHPRTLVRSLGVLGAVLAALATWTLAVPLLGIHLLIRFGGGTPQTVMVETVIGASLVGSLVGWGFLALLECRRADARRLWTILAIVALILSLTLPLSAGATLSAKVALATMHLAVAGVLITVLALTSGRRDPGSANAADTSAAGR